MNYEILGTIASVVVLLSFFMKGEEKIRKVNILGAGLFFWYGMFIHSFSVWFLNGCLFILHMFKIRSLK